MGGVEAEPLSQPTIQVILLTPRDQATAAGGKGGVSAPSTFISVGLRFQVASMVPPREVRGLRVCCMVTVGVRRIRDRRKFSLIAACGVDWFPIAFPPEPTPNGHAQYLDYISAASVPRDYRPRL